jgi:hypothetical protein
LEDFNALASSLAVGLGDVRGCLILSRDGLVLGASPADAEASVKPAWVRFAALGDTERGFAQFGGESWCYVRRGPYGAFAIAGPGARPGLVLDQMDQALLAAEVGRGRQDVAGARAPEISLPTSRPRTLLHPEPHHGKEPVVIDVPRSGSAFAAPPKDLPPEPENDLGFGPMPEPFRTEPRTPVDPETPADPGPSDHEEPIAAAWSEPEPTVDVADQPDVGQAGEDDAEAEAPRSEGQDGDPWAPSPQGGGQGAEPWEPEADEQEDVDRFSLAQEFGQLLQRGEDPADG